ncbi:hypothetical protein DUNSADRAFT_15316 [Dunaliella salina]|uniref:EF-hand domain-containing protein n=1 Tax=Dunaliella salina TaxID=3046 RepID=A0ABQ7G5R5_DUNSA|nr:hypothetical protein DUNSADRAFT_15316 [Dunaliella salina]|eukprot:KAF5829916.1 hypothetical protein DUNSADRAFT_15316 [Dunaliella salina]
MDRDKGGTLGVEEIKQLMDMLGMRIQPDELDNVVKQIDTDNSGQVDFDEFLQVMARPQQLPYTRKDVLRAFEMFARNGEPEGYINPEKLEEALIAHCSDKHSPEEIVQLVSCLEVAPNGLIEYKSKVNLFVGK